MSGRFYNLGRQCIHMAFTDRISSVSGANPDNAPQIRRCRCSTQATLRTWDERRPSLSKADYFHRSSATSILQLACVLTAEARKTSPQAGDGRDVLAGGARQPEAVVGGTSESSETALSAAAGAGEAWTGAASITGPEKLLTAARQGLRSSGF